MKLTRAPQRFLDQIERHFGLEKHNDFALGERRTSGTETSEPADCSVLASWALARTVSIRGHTSSQRSRDNFMNLFLLVKIKREYTTFRTTALIAKNVGIYAFLARLGWVFRPRNYVAGTVVNRVTSIRFLWADC